MAPKTTSPTGLSRSDAGLLRRTASPRRVRSLRRGFTLIELIVVLMLITVLLGISAPSLRGFFHSRQTADAASAIVTLANYARSQAASEGRVYCLCLNTESGEYWLAAEQGGALVPLTTDLGQTLRLPELNSMEWEPMTVQTNQPLLVVHPLLAVQPRLLGRPQDDPNVLRVRFYPSGRTDPGTFRLTGRAGEVVTVACESPTDSYRVLPRTEGPS